MEIYTTNVATSGRALSAALTRAAVAFPSTTLAPVCAASSDLGLNKTHRVQGDRPPRGSEALH